MKKNYLRGVSKTLSEREMKLVVGGLSACQSDADCVGGILCINGVCGGGDGSCCAFMLNINYPFMMCASIGYAMEIGSATPTSWWGCNTDEVKSFCGC